MHTQYEYYGISPAVEKEQDLKLLNLSMDRVFFFHHSTVLEQSWQQNTENQGQRSLGAQFLRISPRKTFKTSSVLFCPAGSLRFPSFHIKHGGRRGCILLKVHSWAKNRTPASCLSAHSGPCYLRKEHLKIVILSPFQQAVCKHTIDEWSWLSDSALGWVRPRTLTSWKHTI